MNMHASAGIVGEYLQPLLHTYLLQGGSLSTLAQHAGVSEAWLYQPPNTVNVDQYLALMSVVESLTCDPYLGLQIGTNMRLQNFDFLGYALANASTLGEGLEQVLAFESLVHNLGTSEVKKESGNIRFIWHSQYQAHPISRHLSESVLGGLIHLARQLAGKSIPTLEFTFIHQQYAKTTIKEYQRFCQGQCHFNSDQNSILLAEEVLAWPIPQSIRQALSSIQPIADNLLDTLTPLKKKELLQRPTQHFIDQLQQQIHLELMRGTPTLAKIADNLGQTPRTIQRRLTEAGSGFQIELDNIRSQLAEDYLRYSTMSILDISAQLSFKEQSSFNHFFKSRFDVTPLQYRKQKKITHA